tara:strand:- start:13 stop:381 length:369 start_codon:yes stop_codon:yes gene_type:complete
MKKFLKYLISGFINTLATYFTSILLLKIFNVILVVSNLLGYIVGIFVSFYLNRNFVFKSKEAEIKKQFYKFLCACLFSYLINLIFLIVFSFIIQLNDEISQILSMLTYSISFYIFSNNYIFK